MQEFNAYMRKKMIVSYEITRACNLRCEYCYNLKFLDNAQTHDVDMARMVIDKLTEFKETHPDWELELDILGGDPLMAPNLFDFVEELAKIDIVIWVVTNLMTTDREKLTRLRGLMEFPNVGVAATWHDKINNDVFKENMLFMKESMSHRDYGIKEKAVNTNLIASFVLFNDNQDMINKSHWLRDNDIQYGVTHYYDEAQNRHEKYSEFSDATREVFENSIPYGYDFYLGDEKLTMEQFENMELYKVADNYRVVCEPLNYNIKYDGEVSLSCKKARKRSLDYNIKDGLKPMRLFCDKGDCYCSWYGYKELIGKK